ncbi:universal stress protein [Asanoa sp. NPDC049518]|uniref:universal stress protein n=1 Tax=unclassified Asanoa TaxID=2685164 RepID=UPI0034234892
METDRILVGYDGSPAAEAAVEWAIDEARRWTCGVRLVEVVEWPVRVGPATPRADNWPRTPAYRDTEQALDRTVSVLGAANPDVPITGLVVEGPPATMLAELSTGVQLVVVGNRGRGGFADLLLGSVAAALATHAAGPVAVVRRGVAGSYASGPVVVGVDESPEARGAVSAAFAEAERRGAELVAVRAWQPPQPWHSLGRPRNEDAVEELETAERTLLADALRDSRRATVSVSMRAPETGAARALVEASRGAQLVVVGSRGRGGFRGSRLGSVTRQLLHHAHCPVLVVRAPGANDNEGTR